MLMNGKSPMLEVWIIWVTCGFHPTPIAPDLWLLCLLQVMAVVITQHFTNLPMEMQPTLHSRLVVTPVVVWSMEVILTTAIQKKKHFSVKLVTQLVIGPLLWA